MYKVIKLITPWKLSIQLKYMPLLAANTDNIRYGKANIPGILPSVAFLSVSFQVALLFYGMFRINLWIAYRQMNKKDTLRSPKQKIPSAT